MMDTEKELEIAEADLAKARHELAEAEHHVEEAEKVLEEIIHRDKPFEVEVIYNGVVKRFEVRRDELVKKLLDAAVAVFGPFPDQHRASLFEGARPLDDNKTLEQEGVKPHDKLLLRVNEVKGGR